MSRINTPATQNNTNHAPTGEIVVTGEAKVGKTLSLDASKIADADGLGDFSYRWLSDGIEIDNAIQNTYKPTKDDIDKKLSVEVSYTDGLGNLEFILSNDTTVVKPANTGLYITGTIKNDKLSGANGDDTLVGGLGKDTLTGGLGADIFKYNNVKETGTTSITHDTITDFNHAEGDKIDLSAIKLPSNRTFTFIGSQAFSKTDATGQLRFDSTTHILYGSINADNKPEFSILLSGVNSLVASDFML